MRSELLKNSEDIINLLKKRRTIVENISEIKDQKKMMIRDRQREIEVIRSLGDDRFTESILNMLFEFSIHYECKNEEKKKQYKNEYHAITFEDGDTLIYLLSLIIPAGSIVYSKTQYDMLGKFLNKGVHIINDEIKDPDAYISFNKNSRSDVIIDDKRILFSDKFIENTGNMYSFVIT